VFEKQYQLRYLGVNQYGEASPVTILKLLEETAADHCSSTNYNLYDLMKKHRLGFACRIYANGTLSFLQRKHYN
jgi:hypothetical protein